VRGERKGERRATDLDREERGEKRRGERSEERRDKRGE